MLRGAEGALETCWGGAWLVRAMRVLSSVATPTLKRQCTALTMQSAVRRTLVVMSAAVDQGSTFSQWPSQFDNSLLRNLRAEPLERDAYESRQVLGAHYTRLSPTVKAPRPALVAYSADVAEDLGINPDDCEGEDFLRFFAGAPPKEVECWATVYGASFGGRYGGQRGDGRAISIGQMHGREVQLKGAGVTPYSRRSDGRAVLRSSVREFLGQECMHALGVPTTRSLCLVETGELVIRRWYDENGMETVVREKGAVGTRVARSFVRFGQMELFAQSGQLPLLRELLVHALDREYPHIREQTGGAALSTAEKAAENAAENAAANATEKDELSAEMVLQLFDEACKRQAKLVAEWMRVGYCQGNMNSDNSAVGGVTLDYGPFAFMERFEYVLGFRFRGRGRAYLHGAL